MTALEKTDDESSLSAISFLLSLVIKRCKLFALGFNEFIPNV